MLIKTDKMPQRKLGVVIEAERIERQTNKNPIFCVLML